jgi:hypothetical protein
MATPSSLLITLRRQYCGWPNKGGNLFLYPKLKTAFLPQGQVHMRQESGKSGC